MPKTIQTELIHDFIGGGLRPNPNYKPKAKRGAGKVNPTTVLTDQVVAYVNKHAGCGAWRTSTKGVRNASTDGYMSVGLAVGWPDVTAILYGRFVGIEIKRGNDVQSNAQKGVQAKIEATGGGYLIVSDFATFKTLFDDYVSKKSKSNT